MWKKVLLTLAVWLSASAAPARACSSTRAYVAPSNFELVQMADAIGVFEPISGDDGSAFPFGNATFRLVRTLHGSAPARLTLSNAQFTHRHPSISLADEVDLAFRYHDYGGGCDRTNFDRGTQYLLILGRDAAGSWAPIHYGGSRAKEAYGGEDSAWARTVRRYLGLRALDPAAQQAALAAMRDRGSDRGGARLSPVERTDIDNHLRTPSQWKPTAWLIERLERVRRGEAPDILLSRLLLPRSRNEDALATLLSSLAVGHHPDAGPVFEPLLTASDVPAWERGRALAFFANHGQFPRAFAWIETRLMPELPLLTDAEVAVLLEAVRDVQRGGSYEDGQERWRSDPHGASVWPTLALAIDRYQARTLPQNDTVGLAVSTDAFAAVDYRARPELAVALAEAFDDKVRDWAISELSRPYVAPSDEWMEPTDLLPLRVLASRYSSYPNYGGANQMALVRALCQGGHRRRLALLAISRWGDFRYDVLLHQAANTPGLSDDDRAWLLRALIESKAREVSEDGHRAPPGNMRDLTIGRMMRGEPSTGQALACPAAP